MRLIRDFLLWVGPVSSTFDFLTFYALLKICRASEQASPGCSRHLAARQRNMVREARPGSLRELHGSGLLARDD
jgi:hypothetical protein